MNAGDRRWRITVTPPDWGQDHLTPDAVVAYVDDELAQRPHLRAAAHLSQCRECAAHVHEQGQARSALRGAEAPTIPSALLSSLRSIPQDAELPPPPSGLAMTADGQMVSVLREPAPAERVPAGDGPAEKRSHRRMKLGTGVAVSGLALGALAFGVPSAAANGPVAPPAERGVFGGAVLNGGPIEASLRVPASSTPTARPTGGSK